MRFRCRSCYPYWRTLLEGHSKVPVLGPEARRPKAQPRLANRSFSFSFVLLRFCHAEDWAPHALHRGSVYGTLTVSAVPALEFLAEVLKVFLADLQLPHFFDHLRGHSRTPLAKRSGFAPRADCAPGFCHAAKVEWAKSYHFAQTQRPSSAAPAVANPPGCAPSIVGRQRRENVI
jgi:hypothetical protein